MKKSDLIEQVARQAGLSKSDADKAVNSVCSAISGALAEGEDVRITGFGTFSVATRAARTGRNPQTGQPVAIRAARVARFKAGSRLREIVMADEVAAAAEEAAEGLAGDPTTDP